MASDRTIAALQALADRPGTEAEGILAREMLQRLQAKAPGAEETFRRYVRREVSLDDLLRSMKPQPMSPEEQAFADMQEAKRRREEDRIHHTEIQAQIRARFQKGDRVYYNKWAYSVNCPGIVSAYVRDKLENGTHPWAWINVKFDHLLWPRQVPIWSERGWHLSHDPVGDEEAERLRGV